MSAPEKNRKEDADPTAKPTSPGEADKPVPAADAAKPGMKYVFKISPADPKRNSIDFEDVADK